MPDFNQLMVADMLARLSNTISDTSEEIQGFALEILITFHQMLESLEAQKIVAFPQIFWAVAACLHSPYEQEYLEALCMLECILDKVNLDDENVADTLLGLFPEGWQGSFVGLQPLLMQGFRSTTTEPFVLQILNRLTTVGSDKLIDNGGGRLLFSTLANMPRLIGGLAMTPIPEDYLAVAEDLSLLAEKFEEANAVRVLSAYAKQKFRKEEDLVRQVSIFLRESYFKEFEGEIILFLMCLLSNNSPVYKLKSLKLLQALLPHVDPNRSQLIGAGSELVAPLLRLLRTEFARDCLEVLDEAMRISVAQTDPSVKPASTNPTRAPIPAALRAASRVSYIGGTGTYGLPNDEPSEQPSTPLQSGWFVLHPVTAARTTRHNVNAVVYTCTLNAPDAPDKESIEFSAEDVASQSDPTAVGGRPPSVADSFTADGSPNPTHRRTDSGIAQMVTALDDLDAFFSEGFGPS